MQGKLESMLPLSLLISGCHTEECGTANWLISIGKTQWWRECWRINYRATSCEPQLPLLLACGVTGWASPLILGNNKLFSGFSGTGDSDRTPSTHKGQGRERGRVSKGHPGGRTRVCGRELKMKGTCRAGEDVCARS